jgi:hypothetical protein
MPVRVSRATQYITALLAARSAYDMATISRGTLHGIKEEAHTQPLLGLQDILRGGRHGTLRLA